VARAKFSEEFKVSEETMEECIFCKIANRQAPANIVYEDDLTLAFMDIGHVNPGHTIVALKDHIANIYDIDEAKAAAVFCTSMRIAQALKKAMHPAGMTLLQANEEAGWQTVFHFHIHILPRHAADGVELTWPAKHPPQKELEQYASRIREAITGA
jgi:histidine triad (HIT) family protein